MYSKLFSFCLVVAASFSSFAVDFTVNTTTDIIDINPGDGICEATVATGDCSLRAAIIEANAMASSDSITIPAGIYLLTITGDDNSAMQGDLDIFGSELIITGAGMDDTLIDGNGIDRIFEVINSIVTIQNLTLSNGGDIAATVHGGAMLVTGNETQGLNINAVRFENNRANAGGALYINIAPVIISNSIFTNNTTVALGVTNSFGPAINANWGDVKISSSVIKNNLYGGYAVRSQRGTLEVLNSTFSNNAGGGIRTTNSDALIKFSTFVDNGSRNLSHYSFDGGTSVQIGYSVLQTTASTNCDMVVSLPVSLGYNVANDSSCGLGGTGDMESTDAQLGVLANNGGMTATHKPAITSPAINQIPLVDCLDNFGVPLVVDQRGFIRPFDSMCDIGALEVDTEIIFMNGFE
ncbi:MAG: right-handed parallel beta-helix repeat-containing protein [Proteobacteria bacterium]|nr:right-handed parallel beta-helix repeat-containing protein [Pseudomonadota bacterium]